MSPGFYNVIFMPKIFLNYAVARNESLVLLINEVATSFNPSLKEELVCSTSLSNLYKMLPRSFILNNK
jgi:hypothetical protein